MNFKLSGFVLVCLVGLCVAELRSKTANDSKKGSIFPLHKTLIYKYNSKQVNGLPKASNKIVGVKLDCQVNFYAEDENKVVMQLKNVNVGGLDSNRVNRRDNVATYKKYLEKPVIFELENNQFESLKTDADEPEWSINIKKSIIELVIVDPNFDQSENSGKTYNSWNIADVYQIDSSNQLSKQQTHHTKHLYDIIKTSDPSSTRVHENFPDDRQTYIRKSPFAYHTRSKISIGAWNEFPTIKIVECVESKTRIEYNSDNKELLVVSKAMQELRLVHIDNKQLTTGDEFEWTQVKRFDDLKAKFTDIYANKLNSGIHTSSWFPFIHENTLERSYDRSKLAQAIESSLYSAASDIVADDLIKSSNFGEKIVQLINTLPLLSAQEMLQVYKNLHAAVEQSDNLQNARSDIIALNQAKRQLFLDALPMSGSVEAIKVFETLVNKRFVSEFEASQLCAAFPTNFVQVSESMVESFSKIIDSSLIRNAKLPSVLPTCYIAYGKFLQNVVSNVAAARVEKLVDRLQMVKSLNEKVAIIEAISRAGEWTTISKILNKETAGLTLNLNDDKEIEYVRLVTIYASKHLNEIPRIVASIFRDKTESTNIRIAAFTTNFVTQDYMLNGVKQIAIDLEDEQDEQVKNFVSTFIKSTSKLTNKAMDIESLSAKDASYSLNEDDYDNVSKSNAKTFKSFLTTGEQCNNDKNSGLVWQAQIIAPGENQIPNAAYMHLQQLKTKTLGLQIEDLPDVLTRHQFKNLVQAGFVGSDDFVERIGSKLLKNKDGYFAKISNLLRDSSDDVIDAIDSFKCKLESLLESSSTSSSWSWSQDNDKSFDDKNGKYLETKFECKRSLKEALLGKDAESKLKVLDAVFSGKHSESQWLANQNQQLNSWFQDSKVNVNGQPMVIAFGKLFEQTSYISLLGKDQIEQISNDVNELISSSIEKLTRGEQLNFVKLLLPKSNWHIIPSPLGFANGIARRTPILISLKLRGEQNVDASGKGKFVVHIEPKVLASEYKCLFTLEQANGLVNGVHAEQVRLFGLPLKLSVGFVESSLSSQLSRNARRVNADGQIVELSVEPTLNKRLYYARNIARLFNGKVDPEASEMSEHWLGHVEEIRPLSKTQQWQETKSTPTVLLRSSFY